MWKLGSGQTPITIYQPMLESAPTTTQGRLGFLSPIARSASSARSRRVRWWRGRATPAAVPPGRPGTFTAVHGWLRDGPLVPCPAPVGPQSNGLPVGLDQQRIGFSCPWTWIQPTSAFPSVTNPDGSGSIGLPEGGLFVQNGADGSRRPPARRLPRPARSRLSTRCVLRVHPRRGAALGLIGDVVGP
jgi:hypothetical protein